MSHIVSEIADGVLTLRFNRPEKKNALTDAMFELLTEALARAESDPMIRAVLLTSTGGDFTAGRDIIEFLRESESETFDFGASPTGRFIRTVALFEKPVAAAVGGLAVGLGTTLLLHCDLAFVARDARLSVPFVNLGLAPEAASSLLMPATLGYHRTYSLFALGEVLSGEQAATAGLGFAVDGDECEAKALAAMGRLVRLSADSLRSTKALIRPRDGIMAGLAREEAIFWRALPVPTRARLSRPFAKSGSPISWGRQSHTGRVGRTAEPRPPPRRPAMPRGCVAPFDLVCGRKRRCLLVRPRRQQECSKGEQVPIIKAEMEMDMKTQAGRLPLSRQFGIATLAAIAALIASPALAQMEAVPVVPTIKANVSESTVSFKHVTMEIPVEFDPFNRNLTYLLGRFDPSDFALAIKDPKHGYERLKAAAGDQGLMLFQGTNDHGALFATLGQSRKAIRYHLGNPQIALKMTSHNISAALYAPLTILVYQVAPGTIRVEYDKPSSVFGQFGDPDIDKVGQMLDIKLSNLLYRAAELKSE